MPIRIVRNDITKVKADAVVNTANPFPIIGAGTDSAIYKAAGEEKLLKERQKIGNIERGDAVLTSGFDLCRYIIHTVGPKYVDGTQGEEDTLRSCYRKSLALAKENQCSSVVFPLISTGAYGFPKEEAISIALSEILDALIKGNSMEVILAVLDDASYAILCSAAGHIEQFIDSGLSKKMLKREYGIAYDEVMEIGKKASRARLTKKKEEEKEVFFLSQDDKTLAEMICFYLNTRQEKSSVLYRSVDMDRRLWSRILTHGYHPSKDAVIRICFALKLTLSQSVDLLSRADYAFNPSNPKDLVYMQCIRKKEAYAKTKERLREAGL